MPVIELEKVVIVETSDESLESAAGRGGMYFHGATFVCATVMVPCE